MVNYGLRLTVGLVIQCVWADLAAGTRAGLVNTAQGFRAHRKARQRGGYGLSYGGQGAPAGVAADPVACGVDSVADGRSGEETGHRMALWFGMSTTEWMDCQNFPPGNKHNAIQAPNLPC